MEWQVGVRRESTGSLQVCLPNFSTRLAPVLLINGGDVGKIVQYVTLLLDGVDKGCAVMARLALTTPSSISLELSWISCTDTMSGVFKYFAMWLGDGRKVTKGGGHVLYLVDMGE